jgi:hypothetical protein
MRKEDLLDYTLLTITLGSLFVCAVLIIFGGCATPPPPDTSLCNFHKAHPQQSLLRTQLESACLAGYSPEACELLNKLDD